MRPRLLQVANVGQICGGTAACAWSVTRALPRFAHHVLFLSDITPETRTAFQGCQLDVRPRLDEATIAYLRPDVILLHNTAARRCDVRRWPVPTLLYQHSQGDLVPGVERAFCSRWLAERCGGDDDHVLWQGVPRAPVMPPIREPETRPPLIIGRLCTPTMRKWPASLVPFYRRLAETFPDVSWEFVGCPSGLQSSLREACRERAVFWPAGWTARSRLTTWDALLYHHPQLDESFGRTVAEGMRVGCLPIVDRRGGFIEQLEQGGGWLCDGESDFIRAIEQLRPPDVRHDHQQQAREIADQHWSLDAFARRLFEWMDRV